MAIRRERSAASMFSEPDGATPFRSFTRNFTARSEAGASMMTFQFASNTSPPNDQRIGRKSATIGFVAAPRTT